MNLQNNRIAQLVVFLQALVVFVYGIVIFVGSFINKPDSPKQLYATLVLFLIISASLAFAAISLYFGHTVVIGFIVTMETIFIPVAYALAFGSGKYIPGILLFTSVVLVLVDLLIVYSRQKRDPSNPIE